MTGSAIIDLPTLFIGSLLAALFIGYAHDGQRLARPVDSYVCIQSETNRTPNPGCRFSKAEKP